MVLSEGHTGNGEWPEAVRYVATRSARPARLVPLETEERVRPVLLLSPERSLQPAGALPDVA